MYDVKIDYSRDNLLTDFGMATLQDRYLLPGEGPQDAFARVASAYADNAEHAQRLYDYMSKLWFVPSTPVLANGGATRALPISCYLSEVQDDMHSIVQKWNESVWIAANTGGTGTYWGNIRSIGEQIGIKGKASGVVPFIVVQNSLSAAIDRGAQRRGAAAVYLDVWHPEIEEFIEIRRPTGGDPLRKALFLHNAVIIDDAFMRAVEQDAMYDLRSPKTKQPVKQVKARDLWIRMLTCRIETGEPYMMFSDTVNRAIPEHHKKQGLMVKMSNLCSEIVLPTGVDQYGKDRTAVCCLSSVNLENFEEWSAEPMFVEDLMRYLDNILQDFIDRAPPEFEAARYSALRERSVGLGAMGFHSFLQAKKIPFESVMAKVWNKKMFKHIKEGADRASVKLAEERGPCPDAAEVLVKERFSNKIAIAPNASSSIYCGNASPGIEPYPSNSYNHKTLGGTFNVRNKHLKPILAKYGRDDEETWTSITVNGGSVMHLDFISDAEKDVFKTAFELDQRWLIEHAADRTPYICQSQSLNVFLPADVHKRDLHMIHYMAWKKGVKTLYYCRSKSLQRAEVVSMPTRDTAAVAAPKVQMKATGTESAAPKYEECLACQ
ncbi:MAG: ribonucleoside-diphosphate reductase subunit alpha [Proteobacteria bacterium]|nr:ribonucleoside-diphosphate reductase subunit alpha [Pseudomonadota bacterium]